MAGPGSLARCRRALFHAVDRPCASSAGTKRTSPPGVTAIRDSSLVCLDRPERSTQGVAAGHGLRGGAAVGLISGGPPGPARGDETGKFLAQPGVHRCRRIVRRVQNCKARITCPIAERVYECSYSVFHRRTAIASVGRFLNRRVPICRSAVSMGTNGPVCPRVVRIRSSVGPAARPPQYNPRWCEGLSVVVELSEPSPREQKCPGCGRDVPPNSAGHAAHCPWGPPPPRPGRPSDAGRRRAGRADRIIHRPSALVAGDFGPYPLTSPPLSMGTSRENIRTSGVDWPLVAGERTGGFGRGVVVRTRRPPDALTVSRAIAPPADVSP